MYQSIALRTGSEFWTEKMIGRYKIAPVAEAQRGLDGVCVQPHLTHGPNDSGYPTSTATSATVIQKPAAECLQSGVIADYFQRIDSG